MFQIPVLLPLLPCGFGICKSSSSAIIGSKENSHVATFSGRNSWRRYGNHLAYLTSRIMSIQHHVFLPPARLSALPLPSPSTDHSPLHFHTLSAPCRHPTFSQSSLALRHAALRIQVSQHVPAHGPNTDPVEESKGEEGDMTQSGRSPLQRFKRGDPSKSVSSKRQIKASPDQSRRRSRRLARTSGIFSVCRGACAQGG